MTNLQSVGELDSCFHRVCLWRHHAPYDAAGQLHKILLLVRRVAMHVIFWWAATPTSRTPAAGRLQVLLPLHPAMEPDRVAVPLLQGALRAAAAPAAVTGGTGGARFSTGLPGRQGPRGTVKSTYHEAARPARSQQPCTRTLAVHACSPGSHVTCAARNPAALPMHAVLRPAGECAGGWRGTRLRSPSSDSASQGVRGAPESH